MSKLFTAIRGWLIMKLIGKRFAVFANFDTKEATKLYIPKRGRYSLIVMGGITQGEFTIEYPTKLEEPNKELNLLSKPAKVDKSTAEIDVKLGIPMLNLRIPAKWLEEIVRTIDEKDSWDFYTEGGNHLHVEKAEGDHEKLVLDFVYNPKED